VRALLTGATGFLGGRVAAKLTARGDEVVALVRAPERAALLSELGCEVVPGDLGSTDTVRRAVAGCDSVYHVAGLYKVGIPVNERSAMFETNVNGTKRVLDAAIEAGVARVVHVSTIGVFGNTGRRIVDESYERPATGFMSAYDESKYLAHRYVLRKIHEGAPAIIVQPGGIYGPGDHSEIGRQIDQAIHRRLRVKAFPELGFNFVHVDDAADGVVLAHDKGTLGQSYILGGEITTLGQVIDEACRIVGRRPPRLTVPGALLRAAVPVGPLMSRVMDLPENFAEIVSSSRGVTYWATDARARRELGYAPRDIASGLRDLLRPSTPTV
jgi:dihydroflavonol-4-reductase